MGCGLENTFLCLGGHVASHLCPLATSEDSFQCMPRLPPTHTATRVYTHICAHARQLLTHEHSLMCRHVHRQHTSAHVQAHTHPGERVVPQQACHTQFWL